MPPPPKENFPNKPPAKTSVAEALKKDLDRVIGQIIQGKQREEVVRRVETLILTQEIFQGPVPHPHHLKQYEEICPGSADRLVQMAEAQQRANIDIEKRAQDNDAQDRRRGMWLGFAVFCLIIISAFSIAYLGMPWLSGLFLAASMLSIVPVFINGRRADR